MSRQTGSSPVADGLAELGAPGLAPVGGTRVGDHGIAVIYGDAWGVWVAGTSGEEEGEGDDGELGHHPSAPHRGSSGA